MLKINAGNGSGDFCDGITRRDFIRIGAMGIGGLTMANLLEAEAQAGVGSSHKAVINIFLPGGPPHQDMFDLKMDAPREIRGEFKPVSTNVPGLQICEEFPLMAKMMDKFTVIRSIVGATGGHDAEQCMTGRSNRNQPPGGWPSIGSILSKLNGPVKPDMPPFIGLSPKTGHIQWSDPGKAGFLGPAHAAFRPSAEGKEDMTLNGITLERLSDRKKLLQSFDQLRRDVDNSGLIEGMDAYNQQAFGMLSSGKLADALDLEKEDLKLRDRYGRGTAKLQADGAPKLLDHFLLARRLVEVGVRCVSLSFSRWDWHGGNFRRARQDFPMLDQGLTALIDDLHQRGLDKDVVVVCWGEFGRTPTINKDAGRDHWPRVSCGLLACGGLKHGQVIGATDRLGGEASERPVTFGEVHATLYHALGIDPNTTTVNDLNGRPHYLVENNSQPLHEVV